MRTITKSVLALAAALVLFGVVVGGASAVTVDNWDGNTSVGDTFSVGNDTESVRAYAENVTNDTAIVAVYGINENGTTMVTSGTLTTDAANGTYSDTYTYSALDPATYDQYKLNVTGDGAEMVSIAKVQLVRGGGGGGGGSGGALDGGLSFGGSMSIPFLGSVPTVELLAGGLVLVVVSVAAVSQRRY